MPSIITQNISVAAAQQVRSPEPIPQSLQQLAANPDIAQLANTSRISAEHATVSPDGGSKTRAVENGKRRIHSPFESQEEKEEEQETTPDKGHPSTDGTGRRVSRMA